MQTRDQALAMASNACSQPCHSHHPIQTPQIDPSAQVWSLLTAVIGVRPSCKASSKPMSST